MANELKELHQALHGYADGHRQLAISTTLRPRDQKTLLALSDISGAGARLEVDGYLTGYPLPESGYFALARTWPATEMPRPGCVWTHTLLIDFTDLATLRSLSDLSSLFMRPLGLGGYQSYERPKRLAVSNRTVSASADDQWTRQLIAALYEKPKSRIVAIRTGPESDAAVLALWSQQWPRLRRNFRFCTFAANDRSVEGAAFDLQLLPNHDRSIRSRFSDVVDAEAVRARGVWVDDALQDFRQPNLKGLRSFFRRLGSDVATGREAFRPLCRLNRLVEAFDTDPNGITDAIEILEHELRANQAKAARAMVVKAALNTVSSLDTRSFEFLWSNLDLLEPQDLIKAAAELGLTAWKNDPARLAELLDQEGNAAIIMSRALDHIALSDLIKGLPQVPQLLGVVLAHRPEIVGEPSFWFHSDAVDASLQAADSAGLQTAALHAMFASGQNDLASKAVQKFGAKVVLEAMCDASDLVGRMEVWVAVAAVDVMAVAEFLATKPGISRSLLSMLAQALPPDSIPNDIGVDPWLSAWLEATGSIDQSASNFLAAYLLSRALGSRSQSPGELAKLTFEAVHSATAANLLPDEGWQLLDSRLPWSAFWFSWDRCQRLRVGVTDLFVDRELSIELFASFANNTGLFSELVGQMARRGKGRDFLKRVRRLLKDNSSPEAVERLRIVEHALN